MLRNTFGPNIEEVTRGWKKLRYDEYHDIRCLLDIIQIMRSSKVSWIVNGRAWEERAVIIISNLSNDRSKASFETIPPHNAI